MRIHRVEGRLGDVRRHLAVHAADHLALRACRRRWRPIRRSRSTAIAPTPRRCSTSPEAETASAAASGRECGQPNRELGAEVDCEGTTACNAAPGFDGPSGVGTPKGLRLFKPLLPSAVITPPASPRRVAASFTASGSSDPYPGGTITSATWKWGDGTAESRGISPTHIYAAAGTYTVALTVTDNYGLTSASR